jgi:spectinomycin phosphotransferase
MLERPVVRDDVIGASLQENYGLPVAQIEFLPLGADVNTAVFRVVSSNGTPYFLKLRSGPFHEASTTLPRFLSDHGIAEIISPIPTQAGQLWASLAQYTVILYPFVQGRDGYTVNLSERQWRRFGVALKQIHTIRLPAMLLGSIPRGDFSPRWRNDVRSYLGLIEQQNFDEPIAATLAEFLKDKRSETLELIERTERHEQVLYSRPLPFTLCHSDLHAGNLHICDDETFYIVDWDAPILAPKERDLMFVGAGLMGGWRAPEEETSLFYLGYGEAEIDPVALAYYRCERIVQDIAAYCEQLLLTAEGGEDRESSLRYLMSNYLPNGVIDLAYRADPLSGSSTPRGQ